MARNHGKASEREAFWRGLTGRQRASGQSVPKSCGRAGVSTASSFAWKRKFREPAVVFGGKPGGDRRAGGRRQKKSDRQTKSRRRRHGDPDLAVVNEWDDTVSILRNQGDGSFVADAVSPAAETRSTTPHPAPPAWSDMQTNAPSAERPGTITSPSKKTTVSSWPAS
jgi:hypothetical protein